MTTHLTIVGGGLGGLVSAIAAREAGIDATVLEATPRLGGRARSTPGPHVANWGPHVIYDDGPWWRWLDQRGLAQPAARAPLTAPVLFRWDGRARRFPPFAFGRAVLRLRRAEAPVERSFRDWAADLVGPDLATRVATLMGVTTFDHDPGRLSARFVHGQLRRVTSLPPRARYLPGGWGTLVERLADRARALGAVIQTEAKVDSVPDPPVILAVPLATARELLGDPSLTWTGTRTALLDVAFSSRRGDPFVLSDLDAPGWAEAFSRPDPSLAPPGQRLVQAQVGLRPDESLDDGVARIESLLDAGYSGWRGRETWRRRARVEDESGALDEPGATWRDRPAVDRGDGVFVVGDMVAAPGLLSEVVHGSAVVAVAALAAKRPVGV